MSMVTPDILCNRRRCRIGRGALLASVLVLCACGGGGGGSGGGSGNVATAPGAPTIGAASAGNGGVTISFSAPASDGGSAITAYNVACSAGSSIVSTTGTDSPIAVSGLTNALTYACSVTATNAIGSGPASAAVSVTPAASLVLPPAAMIDPTHIPLGDGKSTLTTPQAGYLFVCTAGAGGGATAQGPWFNVDGTTWDSTAKLAVQGSVSWASNFLASLAGSTRSITGNGLPNHNTGRFPIATTDPAYAYDRNPNSISSQAIAWGLPANPMIANTPSCVPNGAIGILLTGAKLFNGVDAQGRDAVAHEVQDACQGHPESSGAYHYHSVTPCVTQQDTAGQHSPLVGYAADGFGIYGNLGEGGVALTNSALDLCHGHQHAVTIAGQTVVQYHYHGTREFPYTVGCFKGTPTTIR